MRGSARCCRASFDIPRMTLPGSAAGRCRSIVQHRGLVRTSFCGLVFGRRGLITAATARPERAWEPPTARRWPRFFRPVRLGPKPQAIRAVTTAHVKSCAKRLPRDQLCVATAGRERCGSDDLRWASRQPVGKPVRAELCGSGYRPGRFARYRAREREFAVVTGCPHGWGW